MSAATSAPGPAAAMRAAASAYAKLGWYILPIWWLTDSGLCACGDAECRSPGKHPLGRLVPHGLIQATTDPITFGSWWQKYPRANIAITTGPASGLLVLDVDEAEGEASLVQLERQHGDLPELYPMQWTGSGEGWQAFFAYPQGRKIGNSAGKLGRCLDTRGSGGYVLVPPSRTAKSYRWATDRSPWSLPPEPAPDWLLDLLDPPAAPKPARQTWTAGMRENHRPALRALEAELALVAVAPEGRRNDQLNKSAHWLFHLVSEGRLPPDVIRRGLLAAAAHAGLSEREAVATIHSAARARGIPP